MVMVPVHLPHHWVLAVMNIKNCKFEYYCSMGNSDTSMVMHHLRMYLVDEEQRFPAAAVALSPKTANNMTQIAQWPLECKQATMPRQLNGYDCGVFVCKCAELLARDMPLDFSQVDIPNIRKRIGLSLIQEKVIGWSD